jgi:hypothetical protein
MHLSSRVEGSVANYKHHSVDRSGETLAKKMLLEGCLRFEFTEEHLGSPPLAQLCSEEKWRP